MKRVLFIAIAIALSICLVGCGAADKVIDCVREGDLRQAEQIYAEKISGDFEKRFDLEEALDTYLNQLYDELNSGKTTLVDAQTSFYTAQALSFSGDHQNILSKLNALIESKQCYETALAQLEAGDDYSAYLSFSRVIPEDSNYETAQEKRNEVISDSMRTVYAEIEALMNNGQFWEALDLENQVRTGWGDNELLQGVRDMIYSRWLEDTVAQAEQLAENGAYADALNLLTETSNASGEEYFLTALNNAYDEISGEWVQSVLTTAEIAFGEARDYEAAIQVLQESGCLDAGIDAAIEYYQSYAPVMLRDLGYVKKGDYVATSISSKNENVDVNGHTYDYDAVIIPTGDSLNGQVAKDESEAYVTYYLGGEYSQFQGTLYRTYSSLSAPDEYWERGTTLKIFADGVLLYEGPQITQNTYEEYPISLDVSGVRELKFVMLGVWTGSSGWIGIHSRHPLFGIANGMVIK